MSNQHYYIDTDKESLSSCTFTDIAEMGNVHYENLINAMQILTQQIDNLNIKIIDLQEQLNIFKKPMKN
jgi:hypothetical protein